MSPNGSTLRCAGPRTDAFAGPRSRSDRSHRPWPRSNAHYLDILVSLNFDNAVANLWCNSHMDSRIWGKVADVLARSARPNVKMLLLRRYRMTVGSEMR